ncbi:MAG TPA: NAD(P)-binding domain-containing protein [Holophagaceae bacterium]|nr:NAD(P)-binding domain-containing protein [Holophagaceae bacterium]
MEPVLVSFHAPIHDLDQVAKHVAKDGVPEKLEAWQAQTGAKELVYVATCQRVLWILWGGEPEKLGLGPEPVTYKGDAAWRHLLGLAAGLESANVGDREITGQLTDGLTLAQGCGVAGDEASACLDEIIREALRLRTQVGLADGQASVATVALRHIEQAMEPGSRIALVGVGPMSRYLAQRLPERGFKVALANRTVQKAKDLALEMDPENPVDVVSLANLQKDPAGFDAIVTATAAAEPIFTLEAWGALEGRRAMVRMIDLALPADSEPALEQLPWVHRVDLHVFLAETAAAKRQRAEAAQEAAPHLLQAVQRVRRRAAARSRKRRVNEAQENLNAAWAALEQESLDGALGGLSEEQAEAIRQLMRRGRTLAHRALIQGQPPEGAADSSAKTLQSGAK